MKVGQTKTITIPAAAAYGEWTQDAIVTMPRDQIPNSDQFTKGMEVTNAYGQKMKIYDVTDTDIVFDTNHELAGKDLIFDITVLEVK
jgi:peptidylprolyl isomerase